jgi:hypothetical protein
VFQLLFMGSVAETQTGEKTMDSSITLGSNSETVQKQTAGWLGIPDPAHPQVLLCNKGGTYLVQVVQTNEGEFYFPTGEVHGDLMKMIVANESLFIRVGQHFLPIPPKAIEGRWYRHDVGCHFLAISAGTTTEIARVVKDSGRSLRWMTSVELYQMARVRRLSPQLLQVMCIDMMSSVN